MHWNLSVDITPEAAMRLEQARARRNVRDIADVVERAIEIYDLLTKVEGRVVLIRDPDRRERKIKIR